MTSGMKCFILFQSADARVNTSGAGRWLLEFHDNAFGLVELLIVEWNTARKQWLSPPSTLASIFSAATAAFFRLTLESDLSYRLSVGQQTVVDRFDLARGPPALSLPARLCSSNAASFVVPKHVSALEIGAVCKQITLAERLDVVDVSQLEFAHVSDTLWVLHSIGECLVRSNVTSVASVVMPAPRAAKARRFA